MKVDFTYHRAGAAAMSRGRGIGARCSPGSWAASAWTVAAREGGGLDGGGLEGGGLDDGDLGGGGRAGWRNARPAPPPGAATIGSSRSPVFAPVTLAAGYRRAPRTARRSEGETGSMEHRQPICWGARLTSDAQ